MADVLAYAEQREGTLRGTALEVAGVAAEVAEGTGGSAHVLVLGTPGLSGAVGALGPHGADRVRVGEHESLGDYQPEAYARVIAEQVRDHGYGVVLFAASAQGRDLAPRVAALLDVPLAGDVTAIDAEGGSVRLTRPVYSGKVFAHVDLDASPLLFTIRPNVFQPREVGAAGEVETFTPKVDPDAWKVRSIERKAAGDGALDVTEAQVIVSGGRGMKGPDNWHLLEELRDAIGDGATLGASRAVVDAGWRPHGEQVGQTGKTVAPKLYIANAISGAIQHLAGMRTSQTIVAINKDPDAPIFKVADYGIVGDAFEVLPRLTEEIRKLRQGG